MKKYKILTLLSLFVMILGAILTLTSLITSYRSPAVAIGAVMVIASLIIIETVKKYADSIVISNMH